MQSRGKDSSGLLIERQREACGGSAVAKRGDAGIVWAHTTLMQSQKGQRRGRKLPSTQRERIVGTTKRADTESQRAPRRPTQLLRRGNAVVAGAS